jgi:hypothetical protein
MNRNQSNFHRHKIKLISRWKSATTAVLVTMLLNMAAIAATGVTNDMSLSPPPIPREVKGQGSRIVMMHGVPTLEVDGAPLLLVGAQCDIWRSTRQDEKAVAFFDGYREMNATAVSVGIPWSKIELAEDRYDFRFLDWFIDQARKHKLKLVINLFNSNVCGKVREGDSLQYLPNYIL